MISFLSRSFLLVGVASLRIDRDSAVVDHRALQVLGGSTTPRETMRRVLLVRTVMELAACGMFNLHHSFNIDAAELRDAPSLTWPEPTTATTTPLGASIVDISWTHVDIDFFFYVIKKRLPSSSLTPPSPVILCRFSIKHTHLKCSTATFDDRHRRSERLERWQKPLRTLALRREARLARLVWSLLERRGRRVADVEARWIGRRPRGGADRRARVARRSNRGGHTRGWLTESLAPR